MTATAEKPKEKQFENNEERSEGRQFAEFFSDPNTERLNGKIDETFKFSRIIQIKNQIFDFNKVGIFKEKKFLGFNARGSSIYFENCIFTGCISFTSCVFEHVSFKHCHFIEAEKSTPNSSRVRSLEFVECNVKSLYLENCMIQSGVTIHATTFEKVTISDSFTDAVFFSSIRSHNDSVVTVTNSLCRNVDLSYDVIFGNIFTDEISFRAFTNLQQPLTLYKKS